MDKKITIAYYDRDGAGFMGGKEPWFYGEYANSIEAKDDFNMLVTEGYQGVKCINFYNNEEISL